VRREQQRGEVYPVCLALAYIVHVLVPSFSTCTYLPAHTLSCMCICSAASSSREGARTCSSPCSSRAYHMSNAAPSSCVVARAGPAVVARRALCDNNDGGTNRKTKDIVVLAVSPPTRLATANHRDRNGIVVAAAVPREPAKLVIRRYEVMMVPRKMASLVQNSVDCTCIEVGSARSSGLMRLRLELDGLHMEKATRLPRAGRRQSTSRHLSPRPCKKNS
jgi:hypothetical protein